MGKTSVRARSVRLMTGVRRRVRREDVGEIMIIGGAYSLKKRKFSGGEYDAEELFRLVDTIGKQLGLQIRLGADASDKQGSLEERKRTSGCGKL